MPGERTYTNQVDGYTIKEMWLNYQGDAWSDLPQVASWLDQVNSCLGSQSFMNGLTVELWNRQRAQDTDDLIDWNIEDSVGLTNELGIKIDAAFMSSGAVSHELGHYYTQKSGMTWDSTGKNLVGKNAIGSFLASEYRRLRGADYTSSTPEVERLAEDFKYFFGVPVNSLDPNDDYYRQGKRHPSAVAGLKEFIKGCWPVHNYLKNLSFSNFSYAGADYFMWSRSVPYMWWTVDQWECYSGGRFWVWRNGQWV